MLHRKGVAMVAACAALACAGIVHAESNDSLSDGVVLRPNYLQAAPASEPATAPTSEPASQPVPVPAPASQPAAPSKPFMLLMENIGVGKPMEDAGFTVGGYIDGGYTTSANGDSSHSPLAGRFFDTKNNSVVLDQIDVFVDRPVDYGKAATNHTFDIGGHIELVYGWDSGLIHSSGLLDNPATLGVTTGSYPSRGHPENQLDVEQAYLDFALPIGTGLRIRAGKFITLLGWEYINPTTNAFYSHSFLFSFAIPLTQTGVMGEYKINDDFLIDAGITRGWNQTFKDNNGDPDILAEVTWTPQESDFLKKWKYVLTLSEGPQSTHDNHDWWSVVDLQVSYAVDDAKKLNLALNADYGDAPQPGKPAQWYGIAGYASYILNDYLTPNLRLEYYADDTGFTVASPTGGRVSLYEATLNLNIKPFPNDTIGSNLMIRPEIRYDYSGKGFFDATAAGAKHDQFTFGIDAYFTF